MKKISLIVMFALICNFAMAQIEQTSYRGAFAPAPAAMWTDSWTDYDPQNKVYPTANVNVSSDITTNTTWTVGNTYLLKGIIYVKNGATLTIQPGVVVRGESSTANSSLVITKGAKINAIGTAANPIVFTSDKAVGARQKGDWGGLILLGKGAYNVNNGIANIEGIATSTDTEFGGGANPDAADNSGTLKYVRIEFGGYVFTTDKEINGLTLGAVGSGTTIDYVQVSFTNDDAFEWFGGSVNCKHLVSYRNLDDDFDADNGYSGNVQFGLVIRDPKLADISAGSTSEGFEIDNNAAGTAVAPYTSAIFTNCTLIGPSYRNTLTGGGEILTGYKRAARLRRASKLRIFNSLFMDFQEGLHIDGSLSETAALNDELKFKNNILAGIVTTAKVLQVTSPGTLTAGNNASFNMTSWYATNSNTTVTASSGLLTSAYGASATTFTGLDYRPAVGSIVGKDAAFSDAAFTGKLITATVAVSQSQIEQTTYRGAFAPAPAAMWTDNWTNYDPQNKVYPTATINVSTDITTNTTWTVGNTYLLKGIIYVKNGATLTIQPGVVVRGESSTANSSLVITKGAKIDAVGTAANPIVFTSDKAVGSRQKGDWGGVILLGKGAYNVNNGIANIEGIATTTDTEFGGGANPDAADNSGTLKYVRIEFGGYVFTTDKEINGLTLGAVGSGTTIDYVQVSFTNDDAFEWFGGSVNCKHLVSYRNLDDDFDADNGYSGNVQYALVIRDPKIADISAGSTSEGFEIDNNASGTAVAPYTSAIFTNCTLIGPSYRNTLTGGGETLTGYKRAARLRRASKLRIFNSLFMDFQEGLHIDGVASETAAYNDELKFKNNILAGIVTTSKVLQVTSPGTLTAGNNASFNMTSWYAANSNTTVTASTGLLTAAYGTNATTFTGLDYRPAVGSIVGTGADFTDASFTGKLATATVAVAPIEYTSYRGAFAPAPAAMWTDSWTNYDPENTVYPTANVNVSADITTNTTWTADKTYLLKGIIYVTNGATLTIEPGVVVRGDNTISNSSLVITKGAKINAVGTAAKPIVFTSNKPVTARQKGDWGGLILLGKGAYNVNNGIANIEGIATSTETEFGGGLIPDTEDNSGSLKYVRIEFGGYVFATDKEINGLTLGAVGSGTTIDYVQVSFTNDDAFEWFGGSVNCKHLVSYRNLDDDFDADNGYSGKVQFGLVIRDPKIADISSGSTSEGFEVDNNAAGTSVAPYTSAIFTNLTLVGPSYRNTLTGGGVALTGYKRAARLRRASQISIYNSIFMDYVEGLHIDGVASETHALNGDLKFKNNILAGITTTSKVLQVTSPGTLTAGNNASFNMTNWYNANGNTTLAASASLLTKAYGTTAGTYTALDYRPKTGSAALTNSNFVGLIAKASPSVTPASVCKASVASPLTATADTGATLKWYTAATGGTALTAAPTPTTKAVGTQKYYVSQVFADLSESPRAEIVVTVTDILATPGAITGAADQSTLVGTLTEATYSITAVPNAVSYLWTVPQGVNIIGANNGTTVRVNFNNVSEGAGTIGNIAVAAVNAAGCNSLFKVFAVKKALLKAPGALVMTNAAVPLLKDLVTGLDKKPVAIKSFAQFIGESTELTLTATEVVGASSYDWELPAGVTKVSGDTSNVITVNFLNVTSADYFSYTDAKGIITKGLRIGVKARNGVGASVTVNATALTATEANPATTSTAKLLTLTATAPGASALMLTSTQTLATGAKPVAIAAISNLLGQNGVYKLAAVVSPFASSYSWNLPSSVTRVTAADGLTADDSTTSTAPFIYVKFDQPKPASGFTGSLYFGVKAVNGIGSSDSSTANATKFAEITGSAASFSLLKLALALPTVGTVTGKIANACANGEETYTIAPSLASSYLITAPVGTVVTSPSSLSNTTNSLTTTDRNFTVKFNNLVFTSKDNKTIAIKAVNQVGNNVADKILKLTTITCGPTTRIAAPKTVATVSATEVYPNPVSTDFNIDVTAAKAGVLTIAIYSLDNNLVVSPRTVQLQEGVNTINENVSSLNKGIYIVQLINSSNGEVITKKLVKN